MGLQWIDEDDHKLELARVVNEMRKNGEVLSAGQRNDLFSELYWFGASLDYLTNLIHSLPASEQLATLDWLAGEGAWGKAWPQQRFVLAQLREQTGDWSGALESYQAIGSIGTDYAEEIKKGITRCKAHSRNP